MSPDGILPRAGVFTRRHFTKTEVPMSGHSKWATIKHKKGALDAKRGKAFTRLIKEITIAARSAAATLTAIRGCARRFWRRRQRTCRQDNIKRAIQRGTGELARRDLRRNLVRGLRARRRRGDRGRHDRQPQPHGERDPPRLLKERRQPGRNRLGAVHVLEEGRDRGREVGRRGRSS